MSAKIVHDAFVELFRFDGWLLKEMLGSRYGLAELEPQVASPELTQLPAEYRADSVTLFHDRDGVARFAIVVEIQHSKDDDKPFTWPVYLCAARATHRCPTLLIVLAKNDAIARPARASIELGHPGFRLKPIVITPAEIPRIEDLDSARRSPRLAVLSGLTHASLEVASAAFSVLDKVSPEYVEVYRDLIVSALSQPDQELLEAMMEERYEWKSLSAKRAIAAGKEEGRQEGRQEGLQEGQREGRVLAQRDAAVRLARAKLGELSPEEEARINRLEDEESLLRLIIELGAATSRAKAKKALP